MVMKRTLIILTTVAFLSVYGESAKAGWFSASLGPAPSVTLFGQTLTVPIPSVVLGPAAGTSVNAKVSSGGGRLSLPWIKVGVKSPSLTIGVKGAKHTVTASGIKKAAPAKKGKSKKAKK